jgi:uncharacterized protein YbjT (DUF2867 family)
MHIITGGTGHVGAALAHALLEKGEMVTIISRSSETAQEWMSKGAQLAVADIYDTEALHEIFKRGKSIFILNPPADPMTNTSVQEKKTVASMIEALKYSGAEKLVVESTLGARKGDNIGDFGVLYELEKGIEKLSYPYSIIRPAYYMSNWDEQLPSIKENGELISFFPADLKFPMIAPKDIGDLASRLMVERNTPKINSIHGPKSYSAKEVAESFSKALGKKIKVKVVSKTQWKETFMSMGFSEESAESYSNMTEISLKEFENPGDTTGYIKGKTTLEEYIDSLVKKTSAQKKSAVSA